MAYSFAGSAGSQRMTFALQALAAPVTLFIRARSTSSTGNQFGYGFATGSGSNNGNWLPMRGDLTNDPVLAYVQDGTGTVTATTAPSGYSANTWADIGSIVRSAANRSVFLNGTEFNDVTGSRIFSNLSSVAVIGAFYNPGSGAYSLDFAGAKCDAAIWNAELTAAEMASLAKGFSPWRVRPQSLIAYLPLVRQVRDLRAGASITVTGSPSVFESPRLYGGAV